MELFERLNQLVSVLTGGNLTKFCRKLSKTRNTTLSGYLNARGQEKVRLTLIFEILDAYPEINRDWLIFGEGEMFEPGFRVGGRMDERLPLSTPNAEKEVPTPVSDAVRDAEIGLRKAGATDSLVWMMVEQIAQGKTKTTKLREGAPPRYAHEDDDQATNNE